MGYSHYWTVPDVVERVAWNKAMVIVKAIVKKHKALLDSEPVDPAFGVFFDPVHGHGETFAVMVKRPDVRRLGTRIGLVCGGEYCKTNRLSYDQAVCECLLVLRAYLPGFELDSDGFAARLAEQKESITFDGTWGAAIKAVEAYGLSHEGFVSRERAPFCDLGMKVSIKGVDGVRVFDHNGKEQP